METLMIRPLLEADLPVVIAAFSEKPEGQYARYFAEQSEGRRVTLVGFWNGVFVGYLNIVWKPDYVPFREAGIPEIQDFNIVAAFRRRGFGTQMMQAAEQRVLERSSVVGISVGMTEDYGAAQRLYVRLGYLPDGRGLHYDNQPLKWGDPTRVDDSLSLSFTRTIGEER